MKKILLTYLLMSSAFAINVEPITPVSIYNNNQAVKPLVLPTLDNSEGIGAWKSYFMPIQKCIDSIANRGEFAKSSDSSKKAYIESLSLGSGYYVMVDTSHYTTSDVCYIDFTLRQLGYTPHYVEPVERLIVGVFARKPDAEAIANKLKGMKIDTLVSYIGNRGVQNVGIGSIGSSGGGAKFISTNSNVNDSLIDTGNSDSVTKSEFIKIVRMVNSQFKAQNQINQQLYSMLTAIEKKLGMINSSTEQNQTSSSQPLVAKTLHAVNVRTGAGLNYGVVKVLPRHSKLYVVNFNGDWAKVKLHRDSNNTYYVYKELIEVER